MKSLTDAQLHELARKRIDFKSHLIVYTVVIGALWVIWYFTGHGYLWPIWPMAGWGIGLIFHYVFEFRPSQFLSEEEEFKKLKRQNEEHRV